MQRNDDQVFLPERIRVRRLNGDDIKKAVQKGWMHSENQMKQMDPRLVASICEEVSKLIRKLKVMAVVEDENGKSVP